LTDALTRDFKNKTKSIYEELKVKKINHLSWCWFNSKNWHKFIWVWAALLAHINGATQVKIDD